MKNKMSDFFSISIAVVLCGILVVSSPVHAREKRHQDKELSPLTVTAQKREENVQKVPISMDVFTGVDIEDAGIMDMTDITYFSPNLFATPSMENAAIIMRGVSTHNTVLSPAVGIFVNDISYPINRMQDQELLDIERIEVLRGPQGTLYGKNTESGAINIVTRKPDNEMRGKVFGEYGFYDTAHDNVPFYRAGGSFSTPIQKDTLFMGVAFQVKESDGYIKNINNGNENAAQVDKKLGQVHLRWTPSAPWEFSFFTDVSQNKDFYGTQRYEDGAGQSDPFTINWNGGNDWEEEYNNQSFRAEYKGSAFNLLSITSRSDYNIAFTNDTDFGPFPFGDQNWEFDTLAWSQEFRLTSPENGGKFQWVTGVYGATDDTYAKAHTPAYSSVRDTWMENDTLAVFGQGTYTPIAPLHLTAGLRYEHQELEGRQINQFAANTRYQRSDNNDELLPKLSAAYDVTKTIMAYASFSQGFLTGGYDFYFSNGPEDLYFKPEHTTNYEIGVKTSFWENRLIINAAAFHLDIEDKQVVEWPVGQPVSARNVTNAAQAESDGFELELQAKPARGMDLFAGVGYTEAKFDQWVSDQSGGGSYDYSGNYLMDAPRFTFHIGAQYRMSNGLFCRVDLLGTGDYYSDAENQNKVDGREIVNLKLGYEQEHYDVILWANNLFDERYVTSRVNYLGSMVQDGEPRSVGITLRYRF